MSSARSAPRDERLEHVLEQPLGVLRCCLDRLDEALDPLVDRPAAALDEPVRVEDDDASGGQLDDALAVLRAEACPEREPSAVLQHLDAPVRVRDDRRRMSGRREAEDARVAIDDRVYDGRERRLQRVARDPVEPRERRRRLEPLDGDRAESVSKLPHARRRVNALADDVSDDEPDAGRRGARRRRTSRPHGDLLGAGQVARRDLRRLPAAGETPAGRSAGGSPRSSARTRSGERGREPVRPGPASVCRKTRSSRSERRSDRPSRARELRRSVYRPRAAR